MKMGCESVSAVATISPPVSETETSKETETRLKRVLDAIDKKIETQKFTSVREQRLSIYDPFDSKWKDDARFFVDMFESAMSSQTIEDAFLFIWDDIGASTDYDFPLVSMENRILPRIKWTTERKRKYLNGLANIIVEGANVTAVTNTIFCVVCDSFGIDFDSAMVRFLHKYDRDFDVLNYFVRLRSDYSESKGAGFAVCDLTILKKLWDDKNSSFSTNSNTTLLENGFYSIVQDISIGKDMKMKCCLMTWTEWTKMKK